MTGYRMYHCKECHREVHVHIEGRLLVAKNRCDHVPEHLTKSKIKKLLYARRYPSELRDIPNLE